jgi:hypothetical protein
MTGPFDANEAQFPVITWPWMATHRALPRQHFLISDRQNRRNQPNPETPKMVDETVIMSALSGRYHLQR